MHVVGAVKQPGIYELAAGSRLADAIEAAGGPSSKAAVDAVNLARELSDGEQVSVPTKAQVAKEKKQQECAVPRAGASGSGSGGVGAAGSGGSGVSGSAASGAAGATGAAGASSGSGAQGGLINVNTATEAELQTISGIGPATAQKIVADREANGPFARIEDLTRVSGIGDKKLEAMRGSITVG
ncbi:MAG: helix-hairpin-helix domain-containing protein [Coriobacteriia bacterium]|nr:helix-hairpin-helix domain-containing protein [Coriobacteriia bacterium]